MKALHSLWKMVVNTALIFLPVVILVFFTLQYGQPIIELYRDYFLGDPVRELTTTTRSVEQESGTDVPFNQLQSQFHGIRTLDELNDTDVYEVKQSLVRVHRGVVQQLGSGDIRGLHQSYSDSYTQLLNNPVIDQVYNRPELLRNRLLGDVERLGVLPDVPSHPARGIDEFWNSGDTVARIVEEYGNLYADSVSCRRIFATGCADVYSPSVDLTAQYFSQYFTSWPEFSRTLNASPDVFRDRIDELYSRFLDLRQRLEGYLRASPWTERIELSEAFQSFQENYQRQLQLWYGQVLSGINLSPNDFYDRQWTEEFTVLSSFREIEGRFRQNQELRRLVLNERNQNLRENLLDHLGTLYSEVTARHHFNRNFDASQDGLDSLRRTLQTLPGGETVFRDRQGLLQEARTLHERLRTARSERNYSGMIKTLRSVQSRLESDTGGEPWNTLTREYLQNTRDTMAQPSWQPTAEEDSEPYRDLVRLYGEIGGMVQVSGLNQDWVDQTLLALKSRRFNQLRHSVRANLDDGDVRAAGDRLEALRTLDNLPEDLAGQADQVLLQAVIVERLEHGDARLRERFSEYFSSDVQARNRWNQLTDLLETEDGSDQPSIQEDPLNYVNRWKDWISSVDESTELGVRIKKRSAERLTRYLEGLFENFRDRIRPTGDDAISSEELLRDLANLREVMKAATELPEYERDYELSSWENVLEVRGSLANLGDLANNLSKGSLWGSNANFQRFEEQSTAFEWKQFPLDYEAQREQELLRGLFRTLRDRARGIDEASQGDWFQGWGGRLTGSEVLDPWETLIRTVRSQSRHPEISSTAKELIEATEILRRELTPNRE